VEIRTNGKKSQKKEPTLCQSQNRKGWATPEHSLIHFLMIPIECTTRVSRACHPPSANAEALTALPQNTPTNISDTSFFHLKIRILLSWLLFPGLNDLAILS